VEAKPITRLSNEYNNKLLYKIRDSFTETQQNLFVSSFYCYLNYHPTNDFVIDLDDVWKWLGFSQKVKAKELLEKNFIVDKDYKFLLSAQVKQTSDTRGGHNKQTFLMTIRTFKLFCIKAGTEKANEIHEYFVKLEDIVNELIYEESNEMKEKMQKNILLLEKNEQEKQQLQNKFVQLEEENKRLQELKAAVPVIYVYNTNVQLENPDIKIGYSTNIHNRMSEFNTSGKRGKFEYTVEVFDIEVRHIEKIIHIMLSKYRVGGELFKIKVDEAIMVIKRIMNTLKLVNLDDVEERQMKMKKLHDIESNIIDNVYIDKDNTREMSCQTMEEEFIEEKTNIIKDELTIKFDKFIEDKTSPMGEGNESWNYNIPLNELNINITKVDHPVFEYNGRAFHCQITKVPLLRIHNLDENFSNLADNSGIKKELEDFINDNFTHIYQVFEERLLSFVGDNRVMNEIIYVVRGTKII